MTIPSNRNQHRRCPVDYTCLTIDRAIETLHLLVTYSNANECQEIHQMLEELREMNDSLRIWGCDEATDVDELTKETASLKQHLKDIVGEI